MTTSTTPAGPAGASGSPEKAEGGAVVSADLVTAGRLTLTAQYLAGLLAAGMARSAPTPRAVVADLWPEVDPAVVQQIFDRGVETGWVAGGFYRSPRWREDELEVLRARLGEAGFHAMAGVVGRSLGLAARAGAAHPVEEEFGREHD